MDTGRFWLAMAAAGVLPGMAAAGPLHGRTIEGTWRLERSTTAAQRDTQIRLMDQTMKARIARGENSAAEWKLQRPQVVADIRTSQDRVEAGTFRLELGRKGWRLDLDGGGLIRSYLYDGKATYRKLGSAYQTFAGVNLTGCLAFPILGFQAEDLPVIRPDGVLASYMKASPVWKPLYFGVNMKAAKGTGFEAFVPAGGSPKGHGMPATLRYKPHPKVPGLWASSEVFSDTSFQTVRMKFEVTAVRPSNKVFTQQDILEPGVRVIPGANGKAPVLLWICGVALTGALALPRRR